MDEGERGGEGEVRERGGPGSGAGGFLTLKCRATEGGAACTWRRMHACRATAGGAALSLRGPPCRRGCQSRATASGVAPSSAAPP
jgi:hypothetical protein